MPEPALNVIVPLSRTFGQVFISSILTTAFWGMTCLQIFFYLHTYSSDRRAFKAFILLLWLVSTCHEILLIRVLWKLLIARFGDLAVLAAGSPELILAGLVMCLVAAMAQSFFIWRIWRFSNKNWIFPTILIPPTLWIFVGSIVYGSQTVNKPVENLSKPENIRFALSIEITVTVVDVLIASIMSVLLYRGRTGFRTSSTLIVRLIYASIITGVCTAIFGLIGSITLAWPHDLFYALGAHPICSVYCNNVLANLNARQYISTIQWSPSHFTDMELSDRHIGSGSTVQPSGVSGQGVKSPDGGTTSSQNKPLGK